MRKLEIYDCGLCRLGREDEVNEGIPDHTHNINLQKKEFDFSGLERFPKGILKGLHLQISISLYFYAIIY